MEVHSEPPTGGLGVVEDVIWTAANRKIGDLRMCVFPSVSARCTCSVSL
jgi:hypothetical protein